MRNRKPSIQNAKDAVESDDGRPKVDDRTYPSLSSGFRNPENEVLSNVLIAIAVQIGCGVFAFSFWLEEWSVIDSLYFSVVAFTTVGFGDLYPSTLGGKVFMIVYNFVGITVLGIALGIIGSAIVSRQNRAMQTIKDSLSSKMLTYLAVSKDGVVVDHPHEQQQPQPQQQQVPPKVTRTSDFIASMASIMYNELISHALTIIMIVVVAVFIGRYEGWDVLDSIYFASISATTTGFGDYSPSVPAMKVVLVVFLPVSVGAAGAIIGGIATGYMNLEQAKATRSYLERKLTLADLRVMDLDGNGTVSEAEFISYLLVTTQHVDKKTIDDIRNLFQQLDANGNSSLSAEDLNTVSRNSATFARESLLAL